MNKKYISGIIGLLLLIPLFSQSATILFPSGGGTGTSTPPTYGKILVGNANGTYDVVATSTLGITQDLSGYVPYTGGTSDLNLGVHSLISHSIIGDATDGIILEASNGTDIGILGAGNTANVTWYGSHNFSTATQDTIAAFTGTGKTLGSLSTATYPSLTELSYVKGVTSAIQTQLSAKVTGATDSSLTLTGTTLGINHAYSNNFTALQSVNYTANGYLTAYNFAMGTPNAHSALNGDVDMFLVANATTHKTLQVSKLPSQTANIVNVTDENGNSYFEVRPNGQTVIGNLGISGLIDFSGSNSYYIGNNSGTDFYLRNYSSGDYGWYVKAGGYTGIGTNSPSARLHILSTTEQLRSGYDASNYWKATTGSSGTATFDGAGTGAGFVFKKQVVLGDLSAPSSSYDVMYGYSVSNAFLPMVRLEKATYGSILSLSAYSQSPVIEATGGNTFVTYSQTDTGTFLSNGYSNGASFTMRNDNDNYGTYGLYAKGYNNNSAPTVSGNSKRGVSYGVVGEAQSNATGNGGAGLRSFSASSNIDGLRLDVLTGQSAPLIRARMVDYLNDSSQSVANDLFTVSSSTSAIIFDSASSFSFSDYLGVGTTSPSSLFQTFSTATSTISLDSNSASQGSCIEMKDSDGVGYTYITANDGVLTASTVSCK